jgi:hypothetical protein
MSDFASRSNVSSAISHSGTIIRYAFYLAGALAFALIAIVIIKVYGFVSFNSVKIVDTTPSFRLVDSELARLPTRSKVVNGGAIGRIEVRHYGQLHDRTANLSMAMIVPPKPADRSIRPSFADVRNTLAMSATSSSVWGTARHDLETRFGPVRATEARINADGLIKPCLMFLSRFETEAVRLEGAYCEADGSKPSPHRLACILDGLVLDTRLASLAADAFLRERMARRPYCTSTPVSQTLDTQSRRMSPPARWSMPSANRH